MVYIYRWVVLGKGTYKRYRGTQGLVTVRMHYPLRSIGEKEGTTEKKHSNH